MQENFESVKDSAATVHDERKDLVNRAQVSYLVTKVELK